MSEEKDMIAEDGGEPSAETAPKKRWYRRMSRGRKLLLPMITLAFLAIILISFHTILLPFIFACVIVYLMDPIVRRMSSTRLPRWAAVITVYLAFFGILTLGFVFVVPRFMSEMARFAETVPESVAQFRNENLPGINEKVQNFFKEYLPIVPSKAHHEVARKNVRQAWKSAASRATATAVAQTRARAASDIEFQVDRSATNRAKTAKANAVDANSADGAATVDPPKPVYRGVPQSPDLKKATFEGAHGTWSLIDTTAKPVVRVVPGEHGEFELYLDEGELVVTKLQEDAWSIRRPDPRTLHATSSGDMQASIIDLEARVNDMIESVVSTSHERVASVISYTHVVVVGIIHALVTIILTFMVAAFMSIDLPRFTGFFRGLVPAEHRPSYDDLLRRIDRGLSGVVRGQLIICLINGVLTYVGLVILGVKFSLLLALLAGVLSLIPVFGTIISTIPIVLVGLMSGFWTGFLALCWILGIHFVEANILNPQIIGTSAHIHPVIVIFALLAGESAFGLVGALLAVPVASIMLEIFQFARDKMTPEDAPVTVTAEMPAAAMPGSDGTTGAE